MLKDFVYDVLAFVAIFLICMTVIQAELWIVGRLF